MKKKQLLEQLAALKAKREALTAVAEPDNITEHLAATKAAIAEETGVQEQLDAYAEMEKLVKANVTRQPAVVLSDNATERPWGSFGEFLQAVRGANLSTGTMDDRLRKQHLGATGSNETVGSEGGFLVGTDMSAEIIKRAYDVGTLAARCKRIPISSASNGVKLNGIDETSRANGSRYGGVQAYWAGEASTVTASSPKFRKVELELKKLFALWYATEELLADATALTAVATDAVASELAFKLDDAIFRGTGSGMPRGFFADSNIFVSVAKETSQTAATINATNIAKMYARMWAKSIPNSVWLMNQDCLNQLPLMSISNQPIYTPPGGFSVAPFGTLLGRPIQVIEHAETLGTQGDIALVDLSQYALAEKGGVQQASSMHVRFLYDEQVFKFTTRVDGRSLWHSSLTPFKGSATQSPFVFLDTRA